MKNGQLKQLIQVKLELTDYAVNLEYTKQKIQEYNKASLEMIQRNADELNSLLNHLRNITEETNE